MKKKGLTITLILLAVPVFFMADKILRQGSTGTRLPSVNVQPPAAAAGSDERMPDNAAWRSRQVERIVEGMLALRDPRTKLLPSHIGHPGFQKLGFLYDNVVIALALHAAGRQADAEKIMDYFTARLRINLQEIESNADTNNQYGIVKLLPARAGGSPQKGIINAFDYTSQEPQGQGMLEYVVSPGPTSFLVFAMFHVNAKKYRNDALRLAEILLSMQDARGGVCDGDREPGKIHTEPHMDSYSVFCMIYEVTGDLKWKDAADRAFGWFKSNVFHPEDGSVDQGLWSNRPNRVFAEDCYSWTMAGPAGDGLALATLKKMTDYWLRRCLTRVTLPLPDGTTRTLTLVDFTDPLSKESVACRHGQHPMGSIEWTGGAILALQKNAVRFWNAGDRDTAQFYKSVAEILTDQALNSFYSIEQPRKAYVSFYATGQGVAVGPFGSVKTDDPKGWYTPFWNAEPLRGRPVKGGSSVAMWPVFPYFGLNPFVLHDAYKTAYDRIPFTKSYYAKAARFIGGVTEGRKYVETLPREIPDADTQIVEPQNYLRSMWKNFNMAEDARPRDKALVQKYYKEVIRWANYVVNDPEWIELARRDNRLKQKELNGIVIYPWGMTSSNNRGKTHRVIRRYPILNDVGTAMWGLAVANEEIGNIAESKYWICRIIDEVPLHQVAAIEIDADTNRQTKLINGYWNALVAWEDNPGGIELDRRMGVLYREVLKEKKQKSAKPQEVKLPES
jgi:hypothetical protein